MHVQSNPLSAYGFPPAAVSAQTFQARETESLKKMMSAFANTIQENPGHKTYKFHCAPRLRDEM